MHKNIVFSFILICFLFANSLKASLVEDFNWRDLYVDLSAGLIFKTSQFLYLDPKEVDKDAKSLSWGVGYEINKYVSMQYTHSLFTPTWETDDGLDKNGDKWNSQYSGSM